MAVTIDTLQLDIQAADASGAVSSLRKLATALTRFGAALDKLNISKMKQFSSALRNFSGGAGGLAGTSANRFTVSLQQTNKALGTTTKNVGQAGAASLRTAVNFGVFALAARAGARFLEEAIGKSNEYVENLNLFTVAMGEYAEEAKSYAEQVQAAMGIDASDWMRSQGIFNTLLTGFGMANKEAAHMSKNLTQLGYDISSFFNISVNDAMLKLQSGIAGELEPLRRLGWDLSQAKLQSVAMANGIDQSVQSMTQAEKAQLRYVAIMTQVTTAQGDMARTLDSPANQLRILQAQLNLTARALGNIFIPALNAVLPAAIAFLQIIRSVAEGLASLFGFSLPEFDYSGISGAATAAGELDNALGGAGGSAKELKGQLAKFDELNVISQTSGGGGGGGGGMLSGLFDGLELPGYDFLTGIKSQVDDIVNKLQTFWTDFKPSVLGLLAGIAAYKLVDMVSSLVTGLSKLSTGGAIALGIAAIAAGFVTMEGSMRNIFLGIGDNTANVAQMLGSFAAMEVVLTSIGFLLGGAAGAVAGGILGLVVAIVAGVTAWNNATLEKAKQEVEGYYGELTLAEDKIKTLANYRVSTAFTVTISAAIEKWNLVESLNAQIATAQQSADLSLLYINLGIASSAEDIQAYKKQVESVIGLVKQQLDASQAGAILTLSALFGKESEATQKFAATSSAVNETFKKNVDKLASDYFTFLEKAFEDQKFTMDERKVANEMYQAMQEALALAQGMQRRQDMIVSLNEFRLSDLSKASYDTLRTQILDISNKKIEEAKQAVAATRVTLESTVDMAQYNYDHASPSEKAAMLQLLKDAQTALDGYSMDLALDAEIEKINLSASQGFLEAYVDVWGKQFRGDLQDALTSYFVGGDGALEFGLEYNFALTQNPEVGGDPKKAVFAAMQELVLEIDQAGIDLIASKGGKDSEWYKNLVQSLGDSALAAAEDRKVIAAAVKAGKAVPTKILDAFNDYQMGMALTGDLTAQMYLAAKDAAKSPEFMQALAVVEGMGKSLPDAYKDGIAYNLDTITQATDGSISVVVDGVATQFPRVTQALYDNFAALGIDLRDYVKNLPSDIDTSLTDAFKRQNFDQTLTAALTIDTYINERIHSASALTASAQKAIISSKTTASGLLGGLSTLRAAGGFPEKGEMFIAREAGPELVGTIGGKTTVANNDQIVEGIASGVATANQEQNALLREQNALLRAILDKDEGLEPSPAWGAFVEQSSKMYAKAGG